MARIKYDQTLSTRCLERDHYQCQASWITPATKCGAGLQADHIRNRSTHPHLINDLNNLQTLCWKCHTVKTSGEVWASQILGLYGKEKQALHDPISFEDKAEAIRLFSKAKDRL